MSKPKKLTETEAKVLRSYLAGSSARQAAKAAGLHPSSGPRILERPHVHARLMANTARYTGQAAALAIRELVHGTDDERRLQAACALLNAASAEATGSEAKEIGAAVRSEARRLAVQLGPRSGSTHLGTDVDSDGGTGGAPAAPAENGFEEMQRRARENARPELEPDSSQSRRAQERPRDNSKTIRERLGADRLGNVPADGPASDWDALR